MNYRNHFGTREFLVCCLELAAEQLRVQAIRESIQNEGGAEQCESAPIREVTVFLMLDFNGPNVHVTEVGRKLGGKRDRYHMAWGGFTPESRRIVCDNLSALDAQATITEMLLQVDRLPSGTAAWMCFGHNFSEMESNAGLSFAMPIEVQTDDGVKDDLRWPSAVSDASVG